MITRGIALIRRIESLRKKALRYWHTRARSSARLSRIERAVLDHLYVQAASRLGLGHRYLGDVLCLEDGNRRFHVFGVWTDFDSVPRGLICGDKVLVRDQLAAMGLTIPDGEEFAVRHRDRAREFALGLGGPFVVKPARGTSSGRGVHVNLKSAAEFNAAFRSASLFGDSILVERFVGGDNYRVLVYRGQCLSAVRRELPSVAGDGSRTVSELIELTNRERITSDTWAPGDPLFMPLGTAQDMTTTLRDQGFSLRSVPAPGVVVRLSTVCSYSRGATYAEVLSEMHPSIRDAASRAASVASLVLAGVDMIIPDIRRPEYMINEVNTTPSIQIHYFVRNPDAARDPLRTILRDHFELGSEEGATGTVR